MRFGELRPPNYILLKEEKNEVCLWIYHENIGLLYAAVGLYSYKDFVANLVCDPNNKIFMFRCPNCKDEDKEDIFISEFKNKILEIRPKYEEMDVSYRQWSKSNWALMITCPIDDFISYAFTISSNFLKRHYLAKVQGRLFKDMKANVDATTAIIQCDFSENYTTVFARDV